MPSPFPALASVSSASLHRVKDSEIPARKGLDWQRDAFTYNELIAEIGYLHNLTANLVSVAELRVVEEAWVGNEVVANESDDIRAIRVMRAFTGPQGGQKELKRRAALHLQIAGESYLLGTPLKDKVNRPGGFSWEFASTEEIRVTSSTTGKKTVKRNMFGTGDKDSGFVDVEAFIARMWRPDPRFSQRADSPMKRVLPICRELVVLSEVVDAVAKSRLSAGMLFVPEELSFGPVNENEGSDNTDDLDEFVETLMQHMSAPVEDRTSAAGLVPLVVRGASEFGKEIKLIDLARNLDSTYQSLREELLNRIARGLDAPPEVLTGKASLNHWSAYSVDTEFITHHVNPLGEIIAEFITVAYLRPMLIQYENLSELEAQRFHLVFDARSLTARADEGPAATAAWDRLALSDDSYLRSNGFDVESYPDEDERKRRMLEKVLMADPGDYGPVILPVLYPELASVFGPKPAPSTGVSPKAAVPEPAGVPFPSRGESPVDPPANPPSDAPPATAGVESGSDLLVEELTREANAALSEILRGVADVNDVRVGLSRSSSSTRVTDWFATMGLSWPEAEERSRAAMVALSTLVAQDEQLAQGFITPNVVRDAIAAVM